ncbi:MAG: sensor histidine kinase [Chitinophagaceae bacterium]
MKYFVILQSIGFVLFIVFSIVFTIALHGSFSIKLKNILQLRFIFIYFFFIHSLIYIAGVAIRLYKMYSSEKDAKHLAEKSFLSAQLQMLRQQLNPHFLFNNLNIIASTIHYNPTLASDFTKSMASFYRKVLETDNENWVSVKNEIKTIQSYLHLLSVRFEDKLQFTIDVSLDIQNNYVVPDFILQPIVENVVKHNSCSITAPLQIIITAKNQNSLIIKNNYQPKNNEHESVGIGWFNVESRYKFLGAKMPIKYINDGWFYVEVFLIKK